MCADQLHVCVVLRANEEIGEVRSRLKAEVSGLQAQLRREQLKCQSLENNYDQKVSPRTRTSALSLETFVDADAVWFVFQVKEAVELTKLCDELIAQVQTG